MIEQAQLSLLQGQQGSYDASLNKATEWVSSYFEAEDSTTQSLLKGLNDLKSIQVSPALPDITSSLKALKAYLADIHDAKGQRDETAIRHRVNPTACWYCRW